MHKSAKYGIDLEAITDRGWTAFHCACQGESLSILEFIIDTSSKYSIDLDAIDNFGRTGFELAVKQGKENIISFLSRKGFPRKLPMFALGKESMP